MVPAPFHRLCLSASSSIPTKNATDDLTAIGSFSPASVMREATFCRYVNNVQTKMVAKHVHHLPASPRRNRPLSTRIHRSDFYRWRAVQQHRGDGRIHAAGRTRSLLSSPTCSRMQRHGVVDNFQAASTVLHNWPRTKRSGMRITPAGVSHLRNCTIVEAFFFVYHTANGQPVPATVTKSDGIAVTLSPAHPAHRPAAVCRLRSGIFNTANQRAAGQHFDLRVTKFTLIRTFYGLLLRIAMVCIP